MTKPSHDAQHLKKFKTQYVVRMPDKPRDEVELKDVPKKVSELELHNHVHISLNCSDKISEKFSNFNKSFERPGMNSAKGFYLKEQENQRQK